MAASRRASALRPRDSSQRTDSGAIQAISSEVTIGSAPVAATPRQPITGSRLAAIIAANMVPSATGTTIMLEMKVRYRVGVISTISGLCALTAAIEPKPTTKRNIENRIQAPSGIMAHPAAPSEKIRPPPQTIVLRPIDVGDLAADQRADNGADAGRQQHHRALAVGEVPARREHRDEIADQEEIVELEHLLQDHQPDGQVIARREIGFLDRR